MRSITTKEAPSGEIEVWGWDTYNGEDDVFIGTITNPDGHYYFEAYESSPLLYHKILMDIAYELSSLNTEKV